MEDKHFSSMKQQPTSRSLAFSSQPKSPSRPENSEIMNKAQTCSSSMSEQHQRLPPCPRLENVSSEVKEQAEALKLLHRESSSSTGRERLKRHREEVSGKVMIPEIWGQEKLLTDWIDYSPFDNLLAPNGITSAREALIAEGRRACSSAASHQRLRVEIK
ncbi:unnamed protein product [Dovyalis caffra]|uniref:Protein BIC1 n=1 Tax=Dovyalis caffra TaxID=77055 RepID=A0AAV1R5A4_9ROSI|nr:unnamed protein product [Dovyalis caffra]